MFIIIIIVSIVVLGFSLISKRKVLPPTSMAGHIESNPPSHVMKEPMPLEIQKHMIEHADGGTIPGVIINYNCKDFLCDENLILQLESFVEKYPRFVYVVPFKNMDAKIALTRLKEIKLWTPTTRMR